MARLSSQGTWRPPAPVFRKTLRRDGPVLMVRLLARHELRDQRSRARVQLTARGCTNIPDCHTHQVDVCALPREQTALLLLYLPADLVGRPVRFTVAGLEEGDKT